MPTDLRKAWTRRAACATQAKRSAAPDKKTLERKVDERWTVGIEAVYSLLSAYIHNNAEALASHVAGGDSKLRAGGAEGGAPTLWVSVGRVRARQRRRSRAGRVPQYD